MKTLGLGLAALLAASLLPAPALAASSPQEAAQQWLALLDAGRFDAGCEQASALFREGHKGECETALKQTRAMVGSFSKRVLQSASPMPSNQPIPPGEFAEVRFLSEFGGKEVEEIVRPAYEDGTWRVVGYVFNPKQ
jgi:hypothetical protein